MTNPATPPSAANAGEHPSEPCCDLQPLDDLVDYCKKYAREKPEMAALCCFGIGFVLGWKLKIW